jgi:UDP-glucose 4-epimerase
MQLIPVNSPYPNRLAGKRVLVTGGAGFVGSHIVDQLIAHDAAAITVIDNMVRGRPANLAGALQSGRVNLIEGDIRDQPRMDALIADADVVFHQAALRITHCAAEPRLAFDVMGRARPASRTRSRSWSPPLRPRSMAWRPNSRRPKRRRPMPTARSTAGSR